MKQVFIHGLLAGILAGLAAIAFNKVYCEALAVNFSKIINPVSLTASNVIGCMVASLGYFLFAKVVKNHTDTWFNVVFTLLTFATCVGPFKATLPLDIQGTEFFPGLVLPMHFFPQLFWLSVKPLFGYPKTPVQ